VGVDIASETANEGAFENESLPLKIKLPTQSLKQYLRVFPPNGSESADDWAATETGKIKIGDIYTIFQPAQAV